MGMLTDDCKRTASRILIKCKNLVKMQTNNLATFLPGFVTSHDHNVQQNQVILKTDHESQLRMNS